MTEAQTAQIVAVLFVAFPRTQATDRTVDMYRSMLADLDFDAAQTACARLIASSTFLPSVAEIRAMTLDVAIGPRRTGAEAWGGVVTACRLVGHYRPAPEFDDPIVGEVVGAMGWEYLCKSDAEVSDRSRFVALYDELSLRARSDAQAGHALPPAASAPALSPRREAPALPGLGAEQEKRDTRGAS